MESTFLVLWNLCCPFVLPLFVSHADFTAYGYGSCTAFATLHVYAARAVCENGSFATVYI